MEKISLKCISTWRIFRTTEKKANGLKCKIVFSGDLIKTCTHFYKLFANKILGETGDSFPKGQVFEKALTWK